jgi:hypothetical protein
MIIDYRNKGGHHSGVKRDDVDELRALIWLFIDFHANGILPLSGKAEQPDTEGLAELAKHGSKDLTAKKLSDLIESYGGYEGLIWVFKTFRKMRPQFATMLEEYSRRGCAHSKKKLEVLAAEYGENAEQFTEQMKRAVHVLARGIYLRRHNGEIIIDLI